MRTKLIVLNLLLAICFGLVVWHANIRRKQWQAQRKSIHATLKPAPVPPLVSAPKPEIPSPAKYLDVATKDLFAKDRNPDVVIDPPKVEKPKEMPPLPIVYGILGLPSGTKALMAEKPGAASKPVREGDTVGEFRILALDTQNVTFEWDGKPISKKVDELIDRSGNNVTAASQQAAAAQPASGPAAPIPVQTQIQPAGNNTPATSKQLGVEVGASGQSQRTCQAGDNSPAGTIVDGYQKVVQATPFGSSCRWVPVGK